MAKSNRKLVLVRGLARQNSVNEHGLTPKQEAFAQLVARGEGLSEAYRGSYASQGKPTTIHQAASKLASQAKVRLRIEALLKQIEATLHRDSVAIRRHVFSGLMSESRNDKAKPSERITALIALGKIDVVGMFRETKLEAPVLERDPEDVERELRDKLRELFRET